MSVVEAVWEPNATQTGEEAVPTEKKEDAGT